MYRIVSYRIVSYRIVSYRELSYSLFPADCLRHGIKVLRCSFGLVTIRVSVKITKGV